MIYTSPSFWTNKMGDTQAFAAAGYKSLWVAHWTTNPSATVPASNWAGNGWTFWQYTWTAACPASSGASTSTATTARTSGPSCSSSRRVRIA